MSSKQPARLRKLNHLAGSGIIIDESHANLPNDLMVLAWRWLTSLAESWGCRICLSSATVNKFWQSEQFKRIYEKSFSKQETPKAISLLAPDLSAELRFFEQRRIQFDAWKNGVRTFKNVSEFIQHIVKKTGPRLVVINTIQGAAYVANAMCAQEHNVLHLSTALTPKNRGIILEEIEKRLENRAGARDWTLVSTSMAECGLNFSFCNGFSEIRTLGRALTGTKTKRTHAMIKGWRVFFY